MASNGLTYAQAGVSIEAGDALVLVDTGVGDKENEKFAAIYGVENAPVGAAGPTQLESALAEA